MDVRTIIMSKTGTEEVTQRSTKGSLKAKGSRPRAKAEPLDEVDRAILAALQEDGRRPIRAIATATGLRPSTVHQRLARLLQRKVIRRFTIDVDEEAVGGGLVVFLLLSGDLDTYLDDSFLRQPAVLEIFGITGEFDLLIKLRFSGMGQFSRFLIDFRERYRGSVHKTVTMVATAQLKDQRWAVGAD